MKENFTGLMPKPQDLYALSFQFYLAVSSSVNNLFISKLKPAKYMSYSSILKNKTILKKA